MPFSVQTNRMGFSKTILNTIQNKYKQISMLNQAANNANQQSAKQSRFFVALHH